MSGHGSESVLMSISIASSREHGVANTAARELDNPGTDEQRLVLH